MTAAAKNCFNRLIKATVTYRHAKPGAGKTAKAGQASIRRFWRNAQRYVCKQLAQSPIPSQRPLSRAHAALGRADRQDSGSALN